MDLLNIFNAANKLEKASNSKEFLKKRYVKNRNTELRKNQKIDNVLQKVLSNFNIHTSLSYFEEMGCPIPLSNIRIDNINRRVIEIIIEMPSENRFKSAYVYYCAFFHELAHSVRATYMNIDDIKKSLYKSGRMIEEVIAETTTIVLANEFGIATKKRLEYNLDYIKAWMLHYKEYEDFEFSEEMFNSEIVPEVKKRLKIILDNA